MASLIQPIPPCELEFNLGNWAWAPESLSPYAYLITLHDGQQIKSKIPLEVGANLFGKNVYTNDVFLFQISKCEPLRL